MFKPVGMPGDGTESAATDRIQAQDGNSNLIMGSSDLIYVDTFGAPRMVFGSTYVSIASPNVALMFHADNSDISMKVLGSRRVSANDTASHMASPNLEEIISVDNDGAYYNGIDLRSGTVIASVSWNANTTLSGEATLGYRKHHLRAFRLTTGLWMIENMGTHPLLPGSSADWVRNSVLSGVGDPFFLGVFSMVPLGLGTVHIPPTITVSATSLTAGPQTGNLGTIIVKIRDGSGVVIDPTLADAQTSFSLTYMA